MESNRRQFIKTAAIGALGLSLPISLSSCSQKTNPITFGIISDVHKDLIPDANERLQAFIDAATGSELDFIIQLGDFCFPKPENHKFLSIWDSFSGYKLHVLGNHDMDICDKKTCMDFWGIGS